MKDETRNLLEELKKNRVDQDPWVAQQYIGTKLESLGMKKPIVHAIASNFVAEYGDSRLEEIHQIVDELWHAGIFEARSLAASILMKLKRRLDRSSFDLISSWLDDVDNWANCDDVSVFVLANFMFKDEEITLQVSEWVESDNFWRRRAAVTSTIPASREGRSDPRFVTDMVRSLLEDDEYFVTKSLGWALRELGKSKPEAVVSFLKEYAEKLDKDQLKKAVKYLPENLAVGILE